MTEQVHGTGAPKTHHNTVKNDAKPYATDRSNIQSRMAVPVYGGSPTGPLHLAKCAVGLWADPAIVIALAFMCGKMCIRTGWGFPRPLAALLLEHVLLGDLAAKAVAEWLTRIGGLSSEEVAEAVSRADAHALDKFDGRGHHKPIGTDTFDGDPDA